MEKKRKKESNYDYKEGEIPSAHEIYKMSKIVYGGLKNKFGQATPQEETARLKAEIADLKAQNAAVQQKQSLETELKELKKTATNLNLAPIDAVITIGPKEYNVRKLNAMRNGEVLASPDRKTQLFYVNTDNTPRWYVVKNAGVLKWDVKRITEAEYTKMAQEFSGAPAPPPVPPGSEVPGV